MTREEIETEIKNLERQQQQGREMVSQGNEVVQQTTGAIKALKFILARMQQEEAARSRCEVDVPGMGPLPAEVLASSNGECRG